METDRPITKRLAAMQNQSSAAQGTIPGHFVPNPRPRRQTARMSTGGKSPRDSKTQNATETTPSKSLSERGKLLKRRRSSNKSSTRSSKRSKKTSTLFDESDEEDESDDMDLVHDVSDDEKNPFINDEADEDEDEVEDGEDDEDDDDGKIVLRDEDPSPDSAEAVPSGPPVRSEASHVATAPNVTDDNLRTLLHRLLSVPGAIEALTGAPFTVASGASGTDATPVLDAQVRASGAPAAPPPAAAPAAKVRTKASGRAGKGKSTSATTSAGSAPAPPTAAVPSSSTPTDPPATPHVALPPATPPTQQNPPATQPIPSGATATSATGPSPAVAAQNSGSPTSPTIYYEDLYPSTDPFSEPVACEVYDLDLEDPGLADIHEKDRPRRSIRAVGFNGTPASNFFRYSDWALKAPDLDLSALRSALLFDSHGQCVNLARVDPAILKSVAIPVSRNSTSTTKNRRQLCVGNEPAIAVTPIYVTESQLSSTPVPPSGARAPVTKFVTGLLHGIEYDRIIGCTGMVFREREMYFNLYYSSVTFSTIPQGSENNTTRRRSQRSYYQGSSSSSSPISPSKRTYLLTTETVPVYDASSYLENKGVSLDVGACLRAVTGLSGDALDNAMKSMGIERTDSEVEGACALVAHSVNVSDYTPKDAAPGQIMNFNILWVLVLGWDNVQSEHEGSN